MASKKIDDLKKRADKRKMLKAQMKGLREEGKHWSGYIKKNERKAKATKAIKTAAEIAELAGGGGALVKAAGKAVFMRAGKVGIKKGSKFAKRSTKAKAAEKVEKVEKERIVSRKSREFQEEALAKRKKDGVRARIREAKTILARKADAKQVREAKARVEARKASAKNKATKRRIDARNAKATKKAVKKK